MLYVTPYSYFSSSMRLALTPAGYRATVEQYQHSVDTELPKGREIVNVPALYIGGKEDAICRPEGNLLSIKAGLLPHLEQKDLFDAGHWTPYEATEDCAKAIKEWLRKNFAK